MWKILGVSILLAALGLALATWTATRSTVVASEPTLYAGAVALKSELETFHRLRVYGTEGGAFPLVVYLRDDGKLTIDGPARQRRHWDGQRLWHDSSPGTGVDPAPITVTVGTLAPWLPLLWQELRGGSITWYARGPGYYGWSRDGQDWKHSVELVSPAWQGGDIHVFLEFSDHAKRLSFIQVWDRTGEIVWSFLVRRLDYDPELPASVFTADLPSEPPAFPELCGFFACPDADPPAPPPPPGVPVQP